MTEAPASKPRLFHPTPGRFLLGLLVAVEGFLLLSEHFQWFPFNDHRGWTVLFALASVAVYLLLMLLGLIASLLVRWRFHFSIWSLVVLLVTVAIPCSWLAVEMKRAREQREVVEEIAKLGGKVGYDYEHDSPPIAAEPIGPWLRKLFGDDFFINAAKAELDDDAQMERLKGLPKLQQLRLAGPQITDAGLQHLEGLTQLQYLRVTGTRITNQGVKKLWQALPNCRIRR